MTAAGRNIVLIGYRGSGKTTVGRLLADARGVPFLDTDELVAAEAGRSIADIFSCETEEGFRRRESAVIVRVAASGPAVVSAGGGAVLVDDNMVHLGRNGVVVWLTAGARTLHERIIGQPSSRRTRPPLTGAGGLDEVCTLLAARAPRYRAWADGVFSSERRRPDELARDLSRWLDGRRRGM